MRIRVPATTANLGPGFDSCGLALTLYLTLEIGEVSSKWEIEHDLGSGIPHDETNVIIATALSLASDLTPHTLKMTCDIPPARGLGSSSAAVVAGIELANFLGKLGLTKERKVEIAAQMEGHPDNVAPAVLGNLVVGAKLEDADFYVRHLFPNCAILAFIPKTELLTSHSRHVLPSELPYKEAVSASAISNVMIAAVLQNDMKLAGEMMERDLWHEKYRAELVPHLAQIREMARGEGAYATCLSGAGPTVLIFAPQDKKLNLMRRLEDFDVEANVLALEVEGSGSLSYE
ncbi:homoserine kinase [Listeria fleischmannii]|uniref:Homoserine kinase n=1 Tax=Listeria fleischmannii TaxID=1069827 RepID=A0A841YDX2_9LIST|nr:homoserine kinase [Listeria fleischmannii]EIA21487.1 homoserine kinase [Listeria fleischmannii subsp. coloradonensis]MBC1398466.1 homoserine kinase [Listeria fleischmannii]MBC1426527.1 homoserine kinase [Listeria fleischmannii]STY46558.1 Homoserine kinase [Listeria fleischmannii subsp. coloradonensis]